MTVIRIAALSILLGSAVAGTVWFMWGAIENLLPKRSAEPEPAKDEKAGAKDAGKAA